MIMNGVIMTRPSFFLQPLKNISIQILSNELGQHKWIVLEKQGFGTVVCKGKKF